LVRAARVVEPDIDAGDELARDADVVVLEEDDVRLEARVASGLDDTTDDVLAVRVLRVSLPGVDDLDGPLGGVEELGRALDVVEKEVGALVDRETPREADREDGRREDLRRLRHLKREPPAREEVARLAEAHIGDELLLALDLHRPELLVRDLVDRRPRGRI